MNKQKNISILGSTGSIGYQAVDVIKKSNDNFKIKYLTVNSRFDLLEKQISEISTENVVLTDIDAYKKFKETTNFKGNILFGDEGLAQAATDDEVDIVLTALVGFSGVKPTYEAVKKGKTIALANKETLVSAGKLITKLAQENNSQILAVDSEHSAILQCLAGEKEKMSKKLYLQHRVDLLEHGI